MQSGRDSERKIDKDMKIIPLTQDKVAYVDDEDFERVSQYRWYALWNGNKWYAIANIDDKTVYLHRLILETPTGFDVDHIDNNGLDNRRQNIRNCTHAENLRNQEPQKNTMSCFKGVVWNKLKLKWQARIKVNGKQRYLGCFDNEDEAALAYNEAAKKYFGEFARLNFIVKPGESYSLFA